MVQQTSDDAHARLLSALAKFDDMVEGEPTEHGESVPFPLGVRVLHWHHTAAGPYKASVSPSLRDLFVSTEFKKTSDESAHGPAWWGASPLWLHSVRQLRPDLPDSYFTSPAAQASTPAGFDEFLASLHGQPRDDSPTRLPLVVAAPDYTVALSDDGPQQITEHLLRLIVARRSPLTDDEVRRVIAYLDEALPEKQGTLEDELGPMFTTATLMKRWDVTRQALHGRVSRQSILGLPASDGTRVYPAFQFVNPQRPERGPAGVLPGLPEVLKILSKAGASEMTVAKWLRSADGRLGERSAEEFLRSGGDSDVVVGIASQDAARWMQ